MSRIPVKICGLSTEETLQTAIDAGADMVGLVFFPKSPRHVSLSDASRLADMARGKTEIVALTVDMDLAGLQRINELVKPDLFQFHGSETPEACAAARIMLRTRIIKAIGVREKADTEKALPYVTVAEWILFDAKPPADSDVPGGHGVPYDWTILKALDLPRRFMLSGGLDPENVGRAIAMSGAPAVDVSSGVERAKGVKDSDLIRAFMAAVRSAEDVKE